MDRLVCIIITTILIIESVTTIDVCSDQRCTCSNNLKLVNCDTKDWQTLDGFEFPSEVVTLTLVKNKLKFDSITDRAKIESLPNLITLNLNQNPLGTIPPFNNIKIKSLSLQDTSLTSVEFPLSYNHSFLQTISLSNNKIRSINENDFLILRNSDLKTLRISSASISSIDPKAFNPLVNLQSLSLEGNQLKSCEFLPSIPLLSSIKLDDNKFTSIPQELSVPKKIKTYSFIHNSISVIDETSPLAKWSKENYTNIQIYLANNSFDCCSSIWFIRFLKTSSKYVSDASTLTCASPSELVGKFLMKINPDDMNCGGNIPSKSWWTIGRVIGITSACVITIGISVFGVIFIRRRTRLSRSGYLPIGGNDDSPYSEIDPLLSGGPVFPRLDDEDDDDNDDGYSTRTYPASTISIDRSEAPTHSTGEGVYAADRSQAGYSDGHDPALISHEF